MSLQEQLARILTERGLRIAIAETTAGGLISSRLVSVPGSSEFFDLAIVAYSRRTKTDVLRVPEEVLDTYGSVSVESASAMAEAVRARSNSDLGLAETGIAGPIRGRSPKPIGHVCIAISSREGTETVEQEYAGDREAIRQGIAEGALQALLGYLTRRCN